MKLLFICFLFIFCPPHHYRPHQPATEAVTPFCKGVVAAFAKSNSNEDKFVSAFAATKQDQVRACLK